MFVVILLPLGIKAGQFSNLQLTWYVGLLLVILAKPHTILQPFWLQRESFVADYTYLFFRYLKCLKEMFCPILLLFTATSMQMIHNFNSWLK